MLKQYVIKLSPAIAKTAVPGGQEMETREAEKGILSSLFSLATNGIKDLKKFNVCSDMVRTIEDLDDLDDLILDEDDLKFAIDGFKASAGKRPSSWAYFPSVFEQIAMPVEYKKENPPEKQ